MVPAWPTKNQKNFIYDTGLPPPPPHPRVILYKNSPMVLFFVQKSTMEDILGKELGEYGFIYSTFVSLFVCLTVVQSPAGQGFWHPDPVMPRNILPQPGPNPKKVYIYGPDSDRPDYILPDLDRTETFYHQPEITRFRTTTNL